MTFDCQSTKEVLTLSELNNRIKGVIDDSFADTYWVRAEMSDVYINSASGHCYIEFVEKNESTGKLTARIKATIWQPTFIQLRTYFEQETGQSFVSGIKVLVQVSVVFHQLYGLNLNVSDIDPAYTVGDMQRQRMKTIRRLKAEGVFDLNRELPFPSLPGRIAVITSPTAAGYEDFTKQLTENKAGYVFYLKLFPAVMQGEKSESSVIAALDSIFRHIEHFDAVVIIRGGGATSDLSCFDSYPLAFHCTQFPLPIITGIGHERDDTVLDMVAHTRMKTPTAVAEFLIGRMDTVVGELNALWQSISTLAADRLLREKNRLQLLGKHLSAAVHERMERCRSLLQSFSARLPLAAFNLLNRHKNRLFGSQTILQQSIKTHLTDQQHFLKLMEQFVHLASPDYILKKGYTLTLREGKIIKRATALAAGNEITTRFTDGEVKSAVL